MRFLMMAVVATFAASMTVAQGADQVTPEMRAMEARLLVKLGPQTRAWIRAQAARQRAGTLEPGHLDDEARKTLPGGMSSAAGDIEALAFLVMMEAAKSANEDLKSTMGSVKAANQQKAAIRRDTAVRAQFGLDEGVVQKSMDRKAKLGQTLSNLMKKLSDSNTTISQNMK